MSSVRDDSTGPEGSSGSFKTLDDSVEELEGALTMAELKAQLQREREAAASRGPKAPEPEPPAPSEARPSGRDDELLDEIPVTDHYLGGFAGWRATRNLRWIV